MRRVLLTVVTMALVVGMMVPAAQARPFIDTAVILFQGTATVCAQTITSSPKPTAPGCPAAKAQGLYGPGQGPGPNLPGGFRAPGVSDKWIQRTGNYSFATTTCNAIMPTNPTPVKTCAISVAGKLAPVAGIGASCGTSHGYGGTGVGTVGGSTYNLSNVGWPVAGAVFPITGTYTFTGTTDPAKDKGALNGKRIGPLVGLLTAQGGAPCIKSDLNGKQGASQFSVVGVVIKL